ncbi:ankyrin repeat domain-containing protein 9-like [Discoglossus pictus]
MSHSNQSGEQEEQCEFSSYIYEKALRNLEPVFVLEKLRSFEYFYWEEDVNLRRYSPSDALMQAVVYNHLQYAQYLLSHMTEESLKPPDFSCCPAPHLALAINYNRRKIVIMILKAVHNLPGFHTYINWTSCVHKPDGRTALHLACKLLSPEITLALLANGASPNIMDKIGDTPLDVILEKFWSSSGNMDSKELCLDYLLFFSPSQNFKMRKILENNPGFWIPLLGEDTCNYLVGHAPATLYLASMQTVLRCLTPAHFPQNMQALPIPQCLNPFQALD